jgi:uncharacterized membrane protein
MKDTSGWIFLVVLGLLVVMAGLELRSGSGLLWKRKPGGPIKSGLGVGLIVIGILLVAFGVVLRISPS